MLTQERVNRGRFSARDSMRSPDGAPPQRLHIPGETACGIVARASPLGSRAYLRKALSKCLVNLGDDDDGIRVDPGDDLLEAMGLRPA